MQRALLMASAALLAALPSSASAQSGPGPFQALSYGTPRQVNSTVASEAAYNQPAGRGQVATPTPVRTAAQGQDPESSEGFGRPNPGRPGYQDPEFRGDAASPQGQSGSQAQTAPAQGEGEDEDPTVLTVNDGFFFDNYTSGSGFGVYGGEAVTSGQERQLELPSAALIARNLGLPIGPGQSSAPTPPVQPTAPPSD